jgi:hypothetical protein
MSQAVAYPIDSPSVATYFSNRVYVVVLGLGYDRMRSASRL